MDGNVCSWRYAFGYALRSSAGGFIGQKISDVKSMGGEISNIRDEHCRHPTWVVDPSLLYLYYTLESLDVQKQVCDLTACPKQWAQTFRTPCRAEGMGR